MKLSEELDKPLAPKKDQRLRSNLRDIEAPRIFERVHTDQSPRSGSKPRVNKLSKKSKSTNIGKKGRKDRITSAEDRIDDNIVYKLLEKHVPNYKEKLQTHSSLHEDSLNQRNFDQSDDMTRNLLTNSNKGANSMSVLDHTSDEITTRQRRKDLVERIKKLKQT